MLISIPLKSVSGNLFAVQGSLSMCKFSNKAMHMLGEETESIVSGEKMLVWCTCIHDSILMMVFALVGSIHTSGLNDLYIIGYDSKIMSCE